MKNRRKCDWSRRRYAEDPVYRARILAANERWRAANKEKVNAALRLKYASQPKWRKAARATESRAKHLKRKYGMTLEDYDRLFKKQKGRCAICREKSRRGPLHVDHDHDKKFVRQLLCGPCNRGLGFFRDDTRLLRRAIACLDAAAKAHRRRGKRPRNGPKKGKGRRKR